MRRILCLALIAIAGALPAGADVVITPVKGDIELTSSFVSCPSNPSGCLLCVNDEDTGHELLMVALGGTSAFLVIEGYAEGFVRPVVEIDGVILTPDILPCGAFFRSGIRWLDRFTPPACNGTPPGVTFQVAAMPETTVTGDGDLVVDIPATEASVVPFRFSVCSMFVHWGAGCNIAESSSRQWRLIVPAALHAVEVGPGDAAPATVSASDFAIDFSSSDGGALSVSHVPADPPVGPPVDHLSGYWDIHGNFEDGTFLAAVSFGFDANALPPEVDPATIAVLAYDIDSDNWDMLATTVDVTAQTATVTIDRLTKFVLVGGSVLPTETKSWGAIKDLYSVRAGE
jgi:hypothetical protein